MIHRENGGTLGMVPWIINPIYTLLYSGMIDSDLPQERMIENSVNLVGWAIWLRHISKSYLVFIGAILKMGLTHVCKTKITNIFLRTPSKWSLLEDLFWMVFYGYGTWCQVSLELPSLKLTALRTWKLMLLKTFCFHFGSNDLFFRCKNVEFQVG